jgi:adenylosuccinate synthase
VLDTFDEVQICTGYRVGDQAHEFFPYDLMLLDNARPSTRPCRDGRNPRATLAATANLPARARAYLERIQELTGVGIAYVSVGTKREQIIAV